MRKQLVLAVTASLVIGAGFPALGQDPSEPPAEADNSTATTASPSPTDPLTDTGDDLLAEGAGAGEDATFDEASTSATPIADTVSGVVGPYRMFDSASDPSTICAYPVGGTRLSQLMARGPRVDFPSSAGQVGWVTWQLLVQRKADDGTWKTIDRTDKLKRTVTVGFSTPFRTQLVPISAPTNKGRTRLVGVLEWFDQGNKRVGRARHVVHNYGWDHYQWEPVSQIDPIGFDQIAGTSTGSCPNRWAA